MSDYKLHTSKSGVEFIERVSDGFMFFSVRGYARTSGKTQSTIQSRIKRGFKGERFDGIKTAEVLTPGGLQGVCILPFSTASTWLIKDAPKVLHEISELGFQSYARSECDLHLASSQAFKAGVSAINYERIEIERQASKDLHPRWNDLIVSKNLPASTVHDYITKTYVNLTAKEARENLPVIQGTALVGLNHYDDYESLNFINNVKRRMLKTKQNKCSNTDYKKWVDLCARYVLESE